MLIGLAGLAEYQEAVNNLSPWLASAICAVVVCCVNRSMAYEGRYRETVKGFGSGEPAANNNGGTSVADTIQTLESDLVALRGCIQSIGTQFDDAQNRAELKRLRGVIKENLSSADQDLKGIKSSGEPAKKMMVDRWAKQLEGHTRTFTELLETEKKATQQNPLSSGATSPYTGDGSGMVSTDLQLQGQTQAMNALEVREREVNELLELERDIVDLRDIQTDIANLVADQGDDIDRIEVQTEKAQGRVVHGLQQTEHAIVLKRQNLKMKLIIGGIVAGVIIAIIVVIIIVVSVVVPRTSS